MSKVLFTCALVVNLLIVSCTAAATEKPTKTPTIFDKLVEYAPLMSTILGKMGEYFSDTGLPDTAISNDDYSDEEIEAIELFLDSLQELFANPNELEKFSLGQRQKESRGQTIFVPEDLHHKFK